MDLFDILKVASTDSIRTQHSKVHPSPGADIARSVWALPLNYDNYNIATEDEGEASAASSRGQAEIAQERDSSTVNCNISQQPQSLPLPLHPVVSTSPRLHRIMGNGEINPLNSNGEENLLFEGLDGSLVHLDDIIDIVKNGEVCDLEKLTENFGGDYLSARDRHGYTPAHWVALNGSVEMMRYLIERSAPIDLPCLGTQGPRPIHWACRKGHAAVVQIMLQSGVNVNAADFKGLTPLHVACMYGRTATAAYLLGMGALNHLTDINGDTALHWAAYKGHADLMRLLMYSGVELQKTDNFGSTPLHLACLSGNLHCVRLLCEKSNMDLEPRDQNCKTPIMLAQAHQHQDIVRHLYNEVKKKSRWIPSISEIWGWLFGGAGNSKGPLLLFLFSVLLWGYPMYMIRVS